MKNISHYILDLTSEGVVIHDEGVVIKCNLPFAKLLGYKNTSEIIGKCFIDLHISPINRQEISRQLEKDSAKYEIEITTIHNKTIPIEIKSQIAEYQNQKLRIAFFRDISEKKNIQYELDQSKELYSLQFNNFLNPICIFELINNELVFTEANKAWTKYTNNSVDFIGKKASSIFSKPDQQQLLRNMIKVAKTRENQHIELAFESVIYPGQFKTFVISITYLKQGKISISFEDITKVQESEEKYRMLSEMNSEGIAIHELGLIISVNKAFCNIFGYSEDELIGKNAIDRLISEESVAQVRKNIEINYNEPYEIKGLKKNGEIIHLELEGHNITYNGHKARLSKVRDITELKSINAELKKYKTKLEELVKKRTNELEEANEKLDLAVSGANLGIWDWHIPSGKVNYNKQWGEILGYSPEDISANIDTWKSLIHKDDQEKVQKTLARNLNGVNEFYNSEHRLRSKSGSWKWILAKGKVAERAPNGIPIRHVGVQIDITKNKEHEKKLIEAKNTTEQTLKKLREKTESFNLVTNTLEIGITETNAITGEVKWDETCYKIHGYSKNTSINLDKYITDIVYADDKETFLPLFYKAIDKKHKRWKGEYRIIKPDGSIRWISDDHVFTYDKAGKVIKWNSVKTDTTERKKLEEDLQRAIKKQLLLNKELLKQKDQLEKTQKQLIQSEKMASIGLLSAGIAHEINNPINYISGGLSGLKKTCQHINNIIKNNRQCSEENNFYKELEAKLKVVDKMVSGMDLGVIKTTQIINSMKAFSSSTENNFETVAIPDILGSTITMLYNTYKTRIDIRQIHDENPVIKAIPGKLQQVFMNILSNAIQAIPDKGEIIIKTKWNKAKDTLRVSIKDNGTGMPADVQKRIFEPFFSTKKVGEGIGLGLYLSYSYIEQHSGNIKVNSSSKGTEFIIELPQIK